MLLTPRRGSVRTLPALILTTALVGSLAACATPNGGGCSPVIPEGETAGYISATGEVGTQPEIDFPTPLSVTSAQSAVLTTGEGERIDAGETVDMQATLLDATTGEVLGATSYSPEGEPIRRAAGSGLDVIADAVQCATVGSRIAVVNTWTEFYGDAEAAAAQGVDPEASVVLVLDLEASYLGRATGAPQLGAEGVPAVVTTPEGVPGVTIPNSDPSTDLIAHTLVLGSGAPLEAGDPAVLHYTGIVWESGDIFDSSWERGVPATFPIVSFEDDPAGIVPGLAQALEGKTVGSQVVVVIPPALGYPEGQAPATIPAGSTMVFVVDILGVEGQ